MINYQQIKPGIMKRFYSWFIDEHKKSIMLKDFLVLKERNHATSKRRKICQELLAPKKN